MCISNCNLHFKKTDINTVFHPITFQGQGHSAKDAQVFHVVVSYHIHCQNEGFNTRALM